PERERTTPTRHTYLQPDFGYWVGNVNAFGKGRTSRDTWNLHPDHHRNQRQPESFDTIDSDHPISAPVAVSNVIRPEKLGRIFLGGKLSWGPATWSGAVDCLEHRHQLSGLVFVGVRHHVVAQAALRPAVDVEGEVAAGCRSVACGLGLKDENRNLMLAHLVEQLRPRILPCV